MTRASPDPHWFEHVEPAEGRADVAASAEDYAPMGPPGRRDGSPPRWLSRATPPEVDDLATALERKAAALPQLSLGFDGEDDDLSWDEWIRSLPPFGDTG